MTTEVQDIPDAYIHLIHTKQYNTLKCIVLFIKRLDIMLSEFFPDICPLADIAVALWCLRVGKIDVITYHYVTN